MKVNAHFPIKFLFLILIASWHASGQDLKPANIFPIDRGHSFIEFSVKYMGYADMKGRFADFSGVVWYDPSAPEDLSVTLVIKTESIDTDLDFRDNDLKSANWFDVVKFPTIRFQSTKTIVSRKVMEVIGMLTIKDVTKEVVLQMSPPSKVMSDIRGDLQVIFTGGVTIDRTTFGVAGKNWSGVKEGMTAVADKVNIEFSILAKQFKISNFSSRLRNADGPAAKIHKAYKESGTQEAIGLFERLLAAGDIKDFNPMAVVATLLSLEGNHQDAIALAERNQQAFSEISEACSRLGEIYFSNNDLMKAQMQFEQALKLNPDNVLAIEMLRHL